MASLCLNVMRPILPERLKAISLSNTSRGRPTIKTSGALPPRLRSYDPKARTISRIGSDAYSARAGASDRFDGSSGLALKDRQIRRCRYQWS
jgi:hypothetical protein